MSKVSTKRRNSEDLEPKKEVDDKDLSPAEQQRKIFKNMRLRRITKENHGSDIHKVAFFYRNLKFDDQGIAQRYEGDTSNLLATVGACQLSIYDNEHCVNHLDLLSNYDLAQLNDENVNHELYSFCWLYLHNMVYLATAGADTEIHILSMAKSEEEKVLEGHTKSILSLEAHPVHHNIMLSISKDKTIRLWDAEKGNCLVIYSCEATCATFDPKGEHIITGNARGEIRKWVVPTIEAEEPLTMPKTQSTLLKKFHGDNHIDCIRFVNDHQVLSKSSNGKIEYWDLETEKTIRSFRVRTGEGISSFDVSLNKQYLAVGSTQGSVFIYDIESGELLTKLDHKRSTKPIKDCTFSRDYRQVIAVGTGGFVLRFDYVTDEILKKWEDWRLKKIKK